MAYKNNHLGSDGSYTVYYFCESYWWMQRDTHNSYWWKPMTKIRKISDFSDWTFDDQLRFAEQRALDTCSRSGNSKRSIQKAPKFVGNFRRGLFLPRKLSLTHAKEDLYSWLKKISNGQIQNWKLISTLLTSKFPLLSFQPWISAFQSSTV